MSGPLPEISEEQRAILEKVRGKYSAFAGGFLPGWVCR